LDREFDEALPRILGGLLTAVSAAMRNHDQVKLPILPRMADFAIWATAAEPALGIEPGEFLKAYISNREAGNETAIEASPVGKVLIDFVQDRGEWAGTSTELLGELDAKVNDKTRELKSWPRTARTLGAVVKRLAPNLRQAGLGVEFGRKGKRRTRLIELRYLEHGGNPASASSASSANGDSQHNSPFEADAKADANGEADANSYYASSAETSPFPEETGMADAKPKADAKIPVRSNEPAWCEL
jgi:hypothetical protein